MHDDLQNSKSSRINWIEASDHFFCRNSHGVPFSRFSDFEHDDRVEQTLNALSHQTTAHLAWRFRQWYKSPRLLAAIAGPPLREILEQMQATPHLSDSEMHPFTIYSCHDVTLLALLYGIGADFLCGDDKLGWRYWPAYASSLVFELVKMHGGSSENYQHVVRVLMNGKAVISLDIEKDFWDGPGVLIGNGPNHMMTVQDFAAAVDRIERRGGQRRTELGADDGDTPRDMSTWTG